MKYEVLIYNLKYYIINYVFQLYHLHCKTF